MNRSLIGLALACVSSLATAQITPSGGGFIFRVKLTKGEHIKFRVPVEISGVAGISPGQSIKLNLDLSLYVKSIDKDHNAMVHGVVDTHLQPPQAGDLEVSQRGQILNSAQTMMGFCLLYPKEPVKIGVPFRTSVPVAVAGADLKRSVSTETGIFTLKGFEGKGAARVARLVFRVAGNRAPGGTILVSMKDGVISKYLSNFYVTLPGASMTDPPAHVKATVVRQ
jgi:hypothetical protein